MKALRPRFSEPPKIQEAFNAANKKRSLNEEVGEAHKKVEDSFLFKSIFASPNLHSTIGLLL